MDRNVLKQITEYVTCGTVVCPPFVRACGSYVASLILGFAITIAPLTSSANPQGGSVAAGQVTIQQTPNTTTINQASQKAVINWQSFNINHGEATHFNQPVGGVALNRISPTQGASQIYGSLTATGQIILVNPAGIYFGPSAYVNVGGLIASTANITDQNFLNNMYQFSKVNGYSGAIVNEGQIIAAQHGLVALMGPGVINNGLIQANLGRVALASGDAFTINFSGDNMISFAIDAKTAQAGVDKDGKILNAGVTNTGGIFADGGKVIVSAKTAAGVLDQSINMQGIVQAKSFGEHNGEIIFSGDPDFGKVTVAAKVDASGKGIGEKGGNVTITGHTIVVNSPTVIDVSGDTGGGDIFVGGNFQGSGPLPNANALVMASGVNLYADAITHGSGGNVILWSDNATHFYGNIYARGGALSGNGGFIETSGKQYLDVEGSFVDTRAPVGATGTWLLDPANIYIALNQASATAAGMVGADASADVGYIGIVPTVFTASGAVNDSLVTIGSLQAALANSNVLIMTDNVAGAGAGNITLVDALSWSSANSLTLQATNNIALNAAVTTGAAGSALILDAPGTMTQSAAIGGAGGLTLQGGGTFVLSQANTYTGATTVSSGIARVQNNAALGTNASGTTVASGAAIEINGSGLSINEALTLNGSGINSGGALVNLANTNTWSGTIALASSSQINSNAGTLNLSGNISGSGTTLTSTGSGNTAISSIISGTGVNLIKNGSGTLTLTGANTFTGSAAVNNGNVILSGANGAATSATWTVNQGGILELNNVSANNTNRLSDSNALTMNGGELIFRGSSSTNASETIGTLTLPSGMSTITVFSGTGGSTILTFPGASRSTGATLLFRGNNLGATAGAGNTNIMFDLTAGLVLAGNNNFQTSKHIVSYAIGDTSPTGDGIGFVTYNRSPTTIDANTTGIRPLNNDEYDTNNASGEANRNVRLTMDLSLNVSRTINSLLFSGNQTYTIGSSAGNKTLTINSGAIFRADGAGTATITGRAGDVLQSGSTAGRDLKIFALGDLTHTTANIGNNAMAGAAGLTKSGSGIFTLSRSAGISGGVFVNEGILRSGIADAFSVSQDWFVRAAGTVELNGFAQTMLSLNLQSGGTSGALVSRGNGTLTLAGNVTLDVNGSGAVGATISGGTGTLALGNSTRTFTIGDGLAAEDLTISSVISGSGGLTKTGDGLLRLSNTANTYTRVTTINAGTLSAAALANGGSNSSIGAAAGMGNGNLVLGGGILQYTGGNVTINRGFTLTAATTSGIEITNAGTTLTMSGSSANTSGALMKLGSGGLTFTGAKSYTGLTSVLEGTMTAGVANALSSGGLTVNGGTYNMGNFSDTVGAVTLIDGTITGGTGVLTGTSYNVQNGTVSAILGGAASLTKTTAGTVELTRANTYTGSTTISGGILSAAILANGGTASSIGSSSTAAANLVLNNGMLRYTGASVSTNRNFTLTAGSLGAIEVSNAAASLTISGASTNTTGMLMKTGAGTLILSGANLYSGATLINRGILTASNVDALGGSGDTSVNTNAALNLTFSSNTLSNASTLTLNGQGPAGAGALVFSGSNITLNNPIVLGSATTIGGSGSGTMIMGGSITGSSNLTIALSNAALSLPVTTLSGGASLNVTTNGAIAQTGALSIAGTSSFTAGANAITLNNASNDFVGSVALSNSGANAVTLSDTNALTLAASSVGSGVLTLNSGGLLTLAGNLSSNNGAINMNSTGITLNSGVAVNSGSAAITADAGSGTFTLSSGSSIASTNSGNAIVIAADIFTNNAGASALNPGSGRFLVWSGNPASDNRGGLVHNFKQYNATYGVTSVLGSGSGFLYTLAPSITPTLTGTVSRTYDGTAVAALTGANYLAAGAVDGDTVTLNNPASGVYNNKNVGTGKNVSVSGIAIDSATNGAVTVYGYQLASTTADANIGIITAAPITISSNAGQTKIYGNNDPGSAATAYGVTSGTLFDTDSLSGAMGRVSGENVGSYNFTQNTLTISDGNSGNNYAITFAGSANPFTITPRSLTGSISNQSKVYGADDPSLSGIGVTVGNVVNTSVTDINGNVTPINDIGNVEATLASLARQAGETVSGGPYNITGATFNSLTGSAAGNYAAPSGLTGTPTLTISQASLTGSIANQDKVYGADDPSLGSIGVTLSGLIDRTVATWNGNVDVDDSALTSSVTSLARQIGEDVGSRNITAATFSAASGNYSAPTLTGAPTLTISQASLTGSIANQDKVYGADDPGLGSMGVTLGGLIDNPAVVTWNGNVAIDDSALTSSVTSLTRQVGEDVGSRNITAATFSAASGNYSAPTLTGTPILTIDQASLTGSIANQNKVYGADDPTLSGIGVTLSGLIDRTVATWNGNVDVDDSALTSNVTSLTRQVGENVGNYNITSSTLSAASGNYVTPTLTGSPFLTISQASLSGSIDNQNKVYGVDDPTISGIGVTLSGIIDNPIVATWNGNTSIDDTGNVSGTLSGLTRAVGEDVGIYNITASSFNLSGSAAGNYSSTGSLTGSPTLTISQASLTGSIANQDKVYGADDPSLSGIGVTLTGLIDRTVATWNGNVDVDDSALTSNVTSLTRQAGENVGNYNITSSTLSAASSNYVTPTLTGSPFLTISQASLTASIADQNKVYGADDPSLSGIGVTLTGLIDRTVATWNGNVDVDDSALTSNITSLARQAGEDVGVRNITSGTFSAASANYSAPTLTGTPTLTISQASLTGAIGDQNKVYGADDPGLSGIGVTLTGLIDRTVATWNGNVDVDDSALTSNVTSLTRQVGENVGSLNITAATFSAASGNYSAPTLTGTPTLTISQASLTGSIANQNTVYGADDPGLSGIGVTLTGLIDRTVSTWNGNVDVDDSALTSNVTSLTRQVGEDVGSRNITAATLSAASGNYSAPTLTGAPTLTISQASLTGSIANQNKVYGADDPGLSGIGVTLTGLIDRTVATWNGNVDVDDSALTSNVTSLTRQAGENVGNYNITSSTLSAASSNYVTPILTGSPFLTISQATLSGSIADQNKVYGTDDPSIAGIGVTLSGVINNPIVVTWNGNTSIDDTGNVSGTLSGLTRAAGENVGNYAITASSFNLSGSAASNYSSAGTLTGSPILTINKTNVLTATIPDQSKVYGTSDPLASSINVALGNVINNPLVNTWNGTVSINDTGAIAMALASYTRVAGETVLGGPYAFTSATFGPLTGSAAGNYDAPVGYLGTPVLNITPATLTASLTSTVSKVYDATLLATLSSGNYALTGVLDGDTVNLNNPVIGTYNTKDVGTDKLVTVDGLAISGASASNYQLASTSTSAEIGTITPATATVTGVTANNKVFDGNTAATLNTASAIVSGIYAGDGSVLVNPANYIANFVSAEVGNGILVIVSNLGLTGANAHNYVLTQPTGLTANITPDVIPTPPVPSVPDINGIVFPVEYQPPVVDQTASLQLNAIMTNVKAPVGPVNSAPITGSCLRVSPLVSVCMAFN